MRNAKKINISVRVPVNTIDMWFFIMTLTRQTTITSNEKNYQNRSVFQPQLVVLYWPYGCTGTWANASSVASGRDEPVSLNAKLGKRELCTRSLMPAQWQHKGSTKLEHDTPVGQQCHVTLTNASGYSKKLYIQWLWVTSTPNRPIL